MQCGEASCAKRARMLFLNQISEIVMDSDSDEVEYNTSDTEDEEVEPCSPSEGSPSSQPPSSPDFSVSTSEDEDGVENMASQQPQSMHSTLLPYSQMRAVYTFTGAPKGRSSEAAHITGQSTSLSILLLFFLKIITLLVVATDFYYHDYLVLTRDILPSVT
jgi:hypothetical protein